VVLVDVEEVEGYCVDEWFVFFEVVVEFFDGDVVVLYLFDELEWFGVYWFVGWVLVFDCEVV